MGDAAGAGVIRRRISQERQEWHENTEWNEKMVAEIPLYPDFNLTPDQERIPELKRTLWVWSAAAVRIGILSCGLLQAFMSRYAMITGPMRLARSIFFFGIRTKPGTCIDSSLWWQFFNRHAIIQTSALVRLAAVAGYDPPSTQAGSTIHRRVPRWASTGRF